MYFPAMNADVALLDGDEIARLAATAVPLETTVKPSRAGHDAEASFDFASGVTARLRASGWRLAGRTGADKVGAPAWLLERLEDRARRFAVTFEQVYRLAGIM